MLYLLAAKVGSVVAGITVLTMIGYIAFTTIVTAKRTLIRKAMNRAEQQSSGEANGGEKNRKKADARRQHQSQAEAASACIPC